MNNSRFVAVVLASLLTSCVSSPTFSRTVYEDPTVLVRLDSVLFQEEDSHSLDKHPFSFTAADLAEILRVVNVQPEISFLSYWFLRNDPQPELAFSNDDVVLLAPHLQAALIKARPNEVAVFSLRRTREDGVPVVTTGGLLLDGDQLIVLLANARTTATTQRKLEVARDAPLQPLGEVDFHFVLGPYQVLLDKKDLPKRFAVSSAQALSVDYRALLVGLSPSGQDSSPSRTDQEISPERIEDKLHQLKIWHEQGLITDDDYQQKRREILKQF